MWPAAVAVAISLPFAVVLATDRTVVWRDTAKLFEPMRTLVVEALREGRLPLWNPHEALGVPLFAQQLHGVLHPVSIVGALLVPSAGIEFLAFAYVLLAAVGAGVLARELGASRAAMAVAAFGFGLSGYVLGMTSIIQYLGAAATAPWAVAAIRAAGRGGRFGTPGAAAMVAFLAFAGEPQWAIVAVVLGASLAVDAGGRRGLTRAAAGIGVGLLIGAVQLVPGWAYFGESMRVTGVIQSERLQWAFAPWRTLELVAPGFFCGRPGGPFAPVYFELGGGGQYGIPFVTSAFVGTVVFVLAAAGSRASRAGRVLAVAALVSLWLAFGHWLGSEQLLHHVPVWGAFRYTEKLLGPFTLCVAVLAALGADRIAASPRRGASAGAVGAGVAALGAMLLLAFPETEDLFRRAGAVEAATLARDRLGIGLLHAALALGGLSVLRFVPRSAAAQGRFVPAVAALVLAQSMAAAPFALHAGPRGTRDTNALEPLHGRSVVARVAVPAGSIATDRPTEPDEFERLSAVESRMGVSAYNVATRLDAVDTYTGLVPGPFARVRMELESSFGPEQMWAAWRRFALTHVVVGPTDDESRAIVAAAVQGGAPVLRVPLGITVFEVPHRPWAFFAGSTITAQSADDARRGLLDALESGSESVVIEGPGSRGLAPGRLLRTSRGVSSLRVEAESVGEAVLVVNDAFWPGWEATIDGRPVPIWRADALVRAVAWPPGRHVLEMRYQPREVWIGVAVAALGCLALALLILLDMRRCVAARGMDGAPTAARHSPS